MEGLIIFEDKNGMSFKNDLREYDSNITYIGTANNYIYGECRYYVDFTQRLADGYGYVMHVQNITYGFTDSGETYELYYYSPDDDIDATLAELVDKYCKEHNINNNINII